MTRFREMTEADYQDVARIICEAFTRPAGRFGVTRDTCAVFPAKYTTQSLRHDLNAGRRFYVLEDIEDADVLGCVCLRTVADSVEVSRLAVEPSLQNRRYGSSLLDHAMKQVEAEGAALARLFIFAQSTELRQWFEKRQFVVVDSFELNDTPEPLSLMLRVTRGDVPSHVQLLDKSHEAQLERFLLSHLDSSAMLLSNLRKGGIIDEGKPRQATYLGALRGGQVIGVVALCWNGTILVQAPEMLDELARTLAATATRPIEGLIALADQARRVTQVLDLPTGRDHRVMMDSHEYLYGLDLDQLRVPESLAFRCRRVEARDVPLLTDWMVDFDIESLNRRLPRAEVEATLVRIAEERDNRWVLEGADGLLSTTGFNAATAEIVQVGGVYTPPPYRGRHYARCAVAASLLEARAQGVKRTVLFTAHENFPAQRAYEAIGYERVGEFQLLLFKHAVEAHLIVPSFQM